jgi:uncharacterized protein (TIGR00266 family)
MEYEAVGSSMQMLNVKLAGGEKIYVDGSKLASKSDNVKIESKLGGGTGFLKGVSMMFAGSTAFLLECSAQEDGMVSLAGVMPGKIKVVELKEGESILVEHMAFLATNDPSKIDVKGSWKGFFSGTGVFLEKFTGPCTVFLHVCGDIVEYDLADGSAVEIDPGHIAAFGGDMRIDFSAVGGLKTELTGGEGFWMGKITGPGNVILHSVSRTRLRQSIAPSSGNNSGGGGALAGGLAGAAAGGLIGALGEAGKKGGFGGFKL